MVCGKEVLDSIQALARILAHFNHSFLFRASRQIPYTERVGQDACAVLRMLAHDSICCHAHIRYPCNHHTYDIRCRVMMMP